MPLGSCGNSIALDLSLAPINRFRPLLSEPSVQVSRTRLSMCIMRLALGTPYLLFDVSTTEVHIPVNISISISCIIQPY